MKFDYNKIRSSLGEVQTTLHWWVEFLSENETDGSIVEKFKNDTQIRVTTAGLPTPEVTHTEVQLQGRTIRYVGKVNKAGTITLTFVEGTDTKVFSAINYWMQKYWTSLEGKQAKTNEVKLKIVLHLLDQADEDTITVELLGCLPSYEPGGELGQDPTPLNPVLTVSYDEFVTKLKEGESW